MVEICLTRYLNFMINSLMSMIILYLLPNLFKLIREQKSHSDSFVFTL